MVKAILATFVCYSLALPALAQCDLSGSPNTSLRSPLIYGAPSTSCGTVAPAGLPPAIGSGPTPVGVTPGMLCPPTLIPSHPQGPSNDINNPSYVVPYNTATAAPPGVLGPSTYAPPSPSTPGYDPGMIHYGLNGYAPPVSVVPINPGGGIFGGAPTTKWGGQDSRDFGRYKHIGQRAYDFGVQAYYGSNSQDGPYQTRPGAVPTQDLYGRRSPMRNNGSPSVQTVAPY